MIFLFIGSFIGMCLVVAMKVLEMKFGKIQSLASAIAAADRALKRSLDKSTYAWGRSRKISRIFIFEFLPSYAYELLIRLKDYVSKKYYQAGNDFRGRRILRSNGSVSFFLQKITEDKAEIKG